MARGIGIDRQITALAPSRYPVVHARALRRAGISRDAVRHRVRSGWMVELLPRTYGIGPTSHDPSRELLCMAGVVAAGNGSAIDGETAATLTDCWDRFDGSIHVRVARSTVPRGGEPFRFHRGPLLDAPRGDAIPLVGFLDMCLQLARSLTSWQLAFVIRRGMYRGDVALDSFERVVAGAPALPGVSVLRDAVRLVRSGSFGTRGPAEDEFLRITTSAGISEPIVNTRGVLGMTRDEPDFVWLPQRVNVEIDGRYHRDDPVQLELDRIRDQELFELAVRVYRIGARDVRRFPRAVVRAVAAALRGEHVPVEPGTRRVVLRP